MTVPNEHDDIAADEAARARAVDPTRSVILQAPAGSGKTTVLIERLLVLLARADAPEEILAITFTRKAAAEMALRVAQVLAPHTAPAADARAQHLQQLATAVRERSAQRGWRLAENPNRLRIQTLDALNRALAVQMPLAARGNGALKVLPQPMTAYRSAARRTLLDAQSDPQLRPDAQLLFERMENDFGRCETLIAAMLEKRTHWLPYLVGDAAAQLATRVATSLEAVVEARLARARTLLPVMLLQTGFSIGAQAAQHLQLRNTPAGVWCALSADNALIRPEHPTLPQWQALANLALTKEGEWRKRLDVRCGFPPEDAPLKQRAAHWLVELAGHRGSLDVFNELSQLPDPVLSADETQVLGVLARLLRLAVAELDVVFAELGRVDYAAIGAAARDALGAVDEPTDLALRLDSRIRHILVDEFQDTSLEQTRLLGLLTAGWMPGDGRTLFLVGDPMQSIYGFREAEVGMFLSARNTGIGTVPLEGLSLRRNFRSAREVVEWNNTVFARCFPELDDARTSAVAFGRSVAARADHTPGQVQLHRAAPGDTRGEALAIAQLIARLRAAQPLASIAILVSARTHAAPIVAALTAQHLTVTGVDLVPLGQLSIVRDLTALTQALDHLGDRTAWLALLRAPWCGLNLQELGQLVGTDRRAVIWERLRDTAVQDALPEAAQLRVRRLAAVLAASFEETHQSYACGREELARRVETAWLRLGGPATGQEEDLAHARAFFDALNQWSREPDWTGPAQLPQRLTRLFAAHGAGEPGAVQIMTIHRAKGLEFDHVILPGLGRKRRGNERQLLQWLDLPHGTRGSDLLMVAVPPAAASGPTALGRYVTRLQEQRAQHEATRLLYVAATRAKQQLHLFGQLDDPSSAKPDPAPRAGTLLERLWPALRGEFPARGPDLAQVSAAPSAAVRGAGELERLSAHWQLPLLPPGPKPVVLPIASYEASPQAVPVRGFVDQAVCEVLRRLTRQRRIPVFDAAELSGQLTARLQRLDRDNDAQPAQLAAGLEILQACLADARLQWIFKSLATATPYPDIPLELTGIYAGRLTSVRVDLSFIDPAGTRWLIDIAPDPGTEPEVAFAARVARYAQLAQALSQAPARAAIYLPARQLFWAGVQS